MKLNFSHFVKLCLHHGSILFWLAFSCQVFSADNWELKLAEGQTKIYSRKIEHSTFLQTKVEVSINTSLDNLLTQFENSDKCWQWIKRCRSTKEIKKVSENEVFSYTILNMPWPISDRDFIFHTIKSVDPLNKVTTITIKPALINNMYNTKYVRGQANVIYRIEALSATSSLLTITMHMEFGGRLSSKVINPILVKELHADINELLELVNSNIIKTN